MHTRRVTSALGAALVVATLSACGAVEPGSQSATTSAIPESGLGTPVLDVPAETQASDSPSPSAGQSSAATPTAGQSQPAPSADALRAALDITEDYHPDFAHGDKPAENQRYIVLHDTEGDSSPESVVDWWDRSGNLVAAHFVVGKDGHIVQCVPLDKIAHHAGYGDAGHNEAFGISEDGRDDMAGSAPIGPSCPDYAMNAWSVGIELVHVGGSGDYPPEQLAALDQLIAYIDAYYGFESRIVDHKAWRTGNSDTSPEFATYLANYQDHRAHA